jgi:hypothetical protein
MVEINLKKIIFLFSISFLINNFASANIYQTDCKTVERKNEIKSLSFVFSFERKNIVINKINNDKAKYKINISNITDKNNFLFDAEDNFFKLEYKPGFSYLEKLNPNKDFNLVSENLNGINMKCSKPKLIKSEAISAQIPKDENVNEINEEQVKKVLEQLKSGKQIDQSNLSELMSTLQKNNSQTNIDLNQLQGLLKSQSFMSQLSNGNLMEKLSSEEFLRMIIEEFKKLTN